MSCTNRHVIRVASFLATALLLPAPALAEPPPQGNDAAAPASKADEAPNAAPFRVLIDLRDDLDVVERQNLARELHISTWRINNADHPDELIYRAPGTEQDVKRLRAALEGDDRVEAVELEIQYEAYGVPNDPLYSRQWHLEAVGVPASLPITRGEGVIVAVLDTGVTARDRKGFKRVEDLSSRSFVSGYDFVHDDTTPDDDHGHGTHVAATIAEVTGNGVGAAGMADRVRIMPVKVLDESGMGGTADIADGIRFAVDEGAQVINLSLGSTRKSAILEDACRYAIRHGVTVVAAAGNQGRYQPGYPAGYPDVIAVAASRFDGRLAPYSNRGGKIDLTAPGGDMSVDQNGDGFPDGVWQNTIEPGNPAGSTYLPFQGTSMAAPHVAGAAALLYSLGVNTPGAVLDLLSRTAEPVAKQNRGEGGAGIIRPDRALRKVVVRNGLWTAGLSLLLALWFRRFGTRKLKGDPPPMGTPFWLGILLGGTGLFFLPWLGLSMGRLTPFLGYGFPHWYTPLFGADSNLAALFFSALPPLALVLLSYPFRTLNRFAGGFGIGIAACLVTTAFGPMALPGVPFWLFERAWLLGNAFVTLFAAYLAMRPERTA